MFDLSAMHAVLGCWICHCLPQEFCIQLSKRLQSKEELDQLLLKLTLEGVQEEMGEKFCQDARMRRRVVKGLRDHLEADHRAEAGEVRNSPCACLRVC